MRISTFSLFLALMLGTIPAYSGIGSETQRQSYRSIAMETPRARLAPMKVGDGTLLYGEVTYSNSMNEASADAITWGLYSFPAASSTTFTPLSIHPSLCANGGGTYRKGKEYFTSYYEDFTGELGYLYFCEVDLETYDIERHALLANSYGSIAADMTYDPVGDVIYAVTFDPNDVNLATYQLVTIDINTGYSNPIKPIARMSAIASDNMGQLWGVRYSDGQLVKIDKLNAEVSAVGATGVNPIYNGSATFDFQTNKLYWSTTERTSDQTGLYEIDLNTGKASLISLYPDNESISTLFIPQDDDVTTLNPVTDVKAEFEGATTDGVIYATAPTTDKKGNALSGNVTVAGYIDGMLSFSKSVSPGGTVQQNVSLEQGLHSLEVVATHPTGGRADKVSLNFYVGYDGPAAVQNLTLTKIDDTHAKLTWTNSEKGANGGTINPAIVYYKITRMPDGKVVEEEAMGNEFTDVVSDSYLRTYTYLVTGFYRGTEGETAESNKVEFGKPCALPYLQTFDTMADYMTFVVKDNNKDETRPTNGIWGWDQKNQAAKYVYHTLLPGDDYLFTPGFSLDKNLSYNLSFNIQTDNYYPERLEVLVGKANDIESMTQVIMPAQDILSYAKYTPYTFNFSVPETGHYYIAFHAVSVRGQYFILLDDVALSEGSSMSSPGKVTELTAVPGDVNGSVKLQFKSPAIDHAGSKLTDISSVKIKRDGKEVASITQNVAPGSSISYTDNVDKAGKVVYAVSAVNANGEGDEEVVECYAGLDTPEVPMEVTHVTNNEKDAVISWKAPTVGVNGGSIAYEPLKYIITDQDGVEVAKDITETTFTDTKIDTSKGQKNKYYFVYASNSAGRSNGTGSDFITYGAPYQDAFAESFKGGNGTETSDWMITIVEPSPYLNAFYGRYWGFEHAKTDRGPLPEPQDNDGGLLIAYTDYVNVESRMISPKINVKGLKNPVLSFYFYHYYNPDAENGYSHPAETMDVETYINGKFTTLLEKKILLIDGNGWYRYDVPLKEAVGDNDFQIAFHTHNYLSYDMHIDNITVHDVNDHNLTIQSITVPENIAINSTRSITVNVLNNGINAADSYAVELYRDGVLYATKNNGTSHAFSKEVAYNFDYTPTVFDGGKTYKFHAKVVYDKDTYADDNTSEALSMTVPASELPAPFGLTGSFDGSALKLRWNEPEDISTGVVTDGFEQYAPFTITNFGEWTVFDNDASITYSIMNGDSDTGDYNYPNAGGQMAFMAFNPREAGITSKLWDPYLGNQMAVCFAAAERDNDDWLISPQVQPGSKVTFMAKSVVDTYGLDKFYFCYSTEDNKIASFKRIGSVNEVPAEWTKYEFTLPDDAVYFAINCVSSDTYALLIDEVEYTSINPVILDLKGFKVYRNADTLANDVIEDNQYTDANVSATSRHTYYVTAIYDKGESALSNPFNFDAAGVDSVTLGDFNVEVSGSELIIRGASGHHVGVYSVTGICLYDGKPGDILILNPGSGVFIVKDFDLSLVAKVVIR